MSVHAGVKGNKRADFLAALDHTQEREHNKDVKGQEDKGRWLNVCAFAEAKEIKEKREMEYIPVLLFLVIIMFLYLVDTKGVYLYNLEAYIRSLYLGVNVMTIQRLYLL